MTLDVAVSSHISFYVIDTNNQLWQLPALMETTLSLDGLQIIVPIYHSAADRYEYLLDNFLCF